LPRLSAPRLSYNDENRIQSYAPPSSGHRPGLWSGLSRPSLIAGALLLVGAALVVFVPQFSWDGLQTGAGEGPVVTTTVTPLEAGAASASDGVADQSPQSAQPALAALALQAPATPASPAPAATAPVAATTKTTGPTAAGPVSALPIVQGPETAKGPSTGIVVFTPTAASWVEVTDAQGAVLLRRMLSAGEVAGATGALPLSVVVGRADVTRVQLRGQAFDLSPIARDNVARFEVK
jgi:cytoskeleton protein RodZ